MTTAHAPETPPTPTLIYRQLSLTLPAFAALKAWQSHWESAEGRRITNSEALSRLILASPAP